MSIGPSGIIGSLAGTPLSQAKGSDAEQTRQASTDQARQHQAEKTAESAAGIGETEQQEQASERDADGRRLWEKPQKNETSKDAEPTDGQDTPRSRDATGQCGNQLDLSG